MRLCVRGKSWTLEWAELDGADGETHYPGREILIDDRITGHRLLDTLIHEGLHAALPHLMEHDVTRAATDIARVLWRLGYRSQKLD